MTRRRISVAAAVSLVLVVIVGGVVAGNAAPAPPTLPPLSAGPLLQRLITAGQAASGPSFSGEASTRFDLGLPQLPADLGGGAAGPMDLLTTPQTYKVWSSPEGLRIANLLPFGERDLVANAREAWFWDSQTQTADHLTYDAAAIQRQAQEQEAAGSPPDPATLARQIVEKLSPYAELSVTTAQWVAGEPCYTLVLTPTSPTTLVGSIRVAIDANNSMPLQVEVYARGAADPSIQAGFTDISFGPVDPSMFTFSPPAGAAMRTKALPTVEPSAAPVVPTTLQTQTRTFGAGFDTVIAVPLDQPLPKQEAALLPYAGPLASIIAVQRGGTTWVLAGAVPVSALQATVAKL